MSYFLAGKPRVHLCNPRFFGGKSRKSWFGVAIVVAFPKTLELFHSVKIL